MKYVMVTFHAENGAMLPDGMALMELELRMQAVFRNVFYQAGVNPDRVNLQVIARDYDPLYATFVAGFGISTEAFNAHVPFNLLPDGFPAIEDSTPVLEGYWHHRRNMGLV